MRKLAMVICLVAVLTLLVMASELHKVEAESDGSELGDLNNDGKVDGEDIIQAAKAFGSYMGHPRWNIRADVNYDNKINGVDMIIISRRFGKTYP